MNFVEIQWIKSLLICSNKPLFLLLYNTNLAVHIKFPDVILCLHPHGYCGLRTQNQTELIFVNMIGRKQKPQTVCGNSTVKVRLTGKHQRTDEQTLDENRS